MPPETMPGVITLGAICLVVAWLIVFTFRLVGAPYRLHIAASDEIKRLKAAIQPSHDASLPKHFASDIPDVRIAEDPIARSLFETSERDKLIPLLEAGKIDAWGRLGYGFPPTIKIPADLWRTNHLEYHQGTSGQSINQTFLRSNARHESTYYDIHFNRAQIERQWPGLWERLPLLEAATRAYEQTKDKEVSIWATAIAKSDDDILTWYCRAMTMPRTGKPPLISLSGIEPPSRLIEQIDVPLFNNYDFEVDGKAIILKELHGTRRFENLSVDLAELNAAINEIGTWRA